MLASPPNNYQPNPKHVATVPKWLSKISVAPVARVDPVDDAVYFDEDFSWDVNDQLKRICRNIKNYGMNYGMGEEDAIAMGC